MSSSGSASSDKKPFYFISSRSYLTLTTLQLQGGKGADGHKYHAGGGFMHDKEQATIDHDQNMMNMSAHAKQFLEQHQAE